MGNDIDVCSKDNLDEIFWQHHGPKDESTIQFIRRGYNKFCDSISAPKRKEYTENDLQMSGKYSDYKDYYFVLEFNMFSQELTLHACLWKRVKFREKYKPKEEGQLCIMYLHTNTKCITDAMEVLCVAHELDAHVLSFDLPGCGKSEGCLSGTIDRDIEHLIEWAQCIIDPEVKIIIWARGMSTAPALQYAENITLGETAAESSGRRKSTRKQQRKAPKVVTPAKAAKAPSKWAVSNVDASTGNTIDYNYNKQSPPEQDTPVVAMVLDSPFIGVQQMVHDGIEKFQGKGYMVPTTLISWCSRLMISALASRLGGLDPFSIHPIKQAEKAFIPCFVYSANEDDYIPSYHGDRVAAAYGGPVERMEFPGKHFTDRPKAVLMSCLPFLIKHVDLQQMFEGEDPAIAEAVQEMDTIKLETNHGESSLYNYSEEKYHDYFNDVTSSGASSGSNSGTSSSKKKSGWFGGSGSSSAKAAPAASTSASNSGRNSIGNVADPEVAENPEDYEIKELYSHSGKDQQDCGLMPLHGSSSGPQTVSSQLKAEDIPKNVSFDNLMALAKSRSSNNLNKLVH